MSCIIHVSGVTAVGKPELAGSIPAFGHYFNIFSDNVNTFPFFDSEKTGFVDNSASFLKSYPLCEVTETTNFKNIFQRNEEKISIFP